MKAGFLALSASAMLAASVSMAAAQGRPSPPPAAAAPPPPPSPAALSVPDPLAGFRAGPRDLYRSPDGSDRFQHGSRYPTPPVVMPPIYPGPIYPGGYYPFGFSYGVPYYETSMAETYRFSMAETYLRRERETARGGLLLEEVPPTAQVYVDGHYVGLAEEFGLGGGTLLLSAGAHRVELRAQGYEAISFSVRIQPNSLVRYRGEMQRAAAKAESAAAASQPAPVAARIFYVIPNCYAGDKPPSGVLPKGCDIKKLQTRK